MIEREGVCEYVRERERERVRQQRMREAAICALFLKIDPIPNFIWTQAISYRSSATSGFCCWNVSIDRNI